MLNLLIANKNLQNLQNLLNYISLYVPDIRISYLAKDGREALNALNSFQYDIVLIDNKLPIYTGLDVLEKIIIEFQPKYEKSIIFLTSDEDIAQTAKLNTMVYDSFLTTQSLSILISTIKRLVAKKKSKPNDNYMKNKIINELQNIGYNLAHIGTHYIVESVLLIVKFNYESENLTKSVYPKISKMYNKSVNNVKTNIIIATDKAYKNMDKIVLRRYFKLADNVKPTPKMVMNAVIQKIQ